MHIFHLALGGCLTAPRVNYGLTEDTGGHIAYVLGAATAQAQCSHVTSVTIVTRAFNDPSLGEDHARIYQPVQPGLVIRRLRTANGAYLAKEALAAELPALTDAFLTMLEDLDERPDVIHAHFADAALLAQAAKDRFDIPFIYTPHSLGIDKLTHLEGVTGPLLTARIAQEKAALYAADAIVVSSRDEAERQISAYGLQVDGKVYRVWPGVDLTRARKTTEAAVSTLLQDCLATPELPMILAIARPVARKNLQQLARTYAKSVALQDRANLVILAGQHGADVQESAETAAVWAELNDILAGADLRGKVALPARHTPADVAAIYAKASDTRGVFVNLAFHEPFGLTLLEAASHGLPVVAGDRGGPLDILAQTGHGITLDPTDEAAIVSGLTRLLSDPVAWDCHAQAALRNVGTFDWTVWADHVTAICADLIAPPRINPRPAYILGSDIDHTLTGSARAAAALAEWHADRRGLFVVATGRSIVEARRILQDWSLPLPDVFVTAVGTEIHRRNDAGRWVLDADYAKLLDSDWKSADIAACVEAAGIAWQADIEQRRWKFGCLGDSAEADRLRHVLRAAGLAAKVIASHGRLIDILPVHGGKGKALTYLARCCGMTAADVIAAGDSGNDVDMLTSCGRGIVVGNALPEIADLQGLPHLYHARASYAAGVLEGLTAFGLAGSDKPSLPYRHKAVSNLRIAS